jgi:hypothetical protein
MSDWRRAMLNKKKELIADGVSQFEFHPEYKRLAECKQDEYYDDSQCNSMFKKSTKKSPTPRRTPKSRKRCATGTRYNKKSDLCEGNTQKRCSKGTRRNKMGECQSR